MIILDTNVVSELTRMTPATAVLDWLDAQPAADVATTAITAAELLYGVARLPDGARKNALTGAVHALLTDDLDGRVEPFDAAAAAHYADLVTARERAGQPISIPDAQIAAICRVRRASLATRNTSDFTGTGIDLIDPWAS